MKLTNFMCLTIRIILCTIKVEIINKLSQRKLLIYFLIKWLTKT